MAEYISEPVPAITREVKVEAVFDDGTRMVVVRNPFGDAEGLGDRAPGAVIPATRAAEPAPAVVVTVVALIGGQFSQALTELTATQLTVQLFNRIEIVLQRERPNVLSHSGLVRSGGRGGLHIGAGLVRGGECRLLVQPLPQDAEANLSGRHVLHQVQHIIVTEEVRRLECGGLHALPECVAILNRDAQQVARPTHRAGRRFQLR